MSEGNPDIDRMIDNLRAKNVSLPDVARCQRDLGTAYLDAGCYDEAMACFKQELDILRHIGDGHQMDVAECYDRISAIYCHDSRQ